ncbi:MULTISPECIES: YchJ family protein [Thiomicrorhabdus]|uniref:YchJ-like middle NTF2-like domain-containing protein n=1 Tax=Thiomicrorhabdus heinhorstiae TaxID=2748010 RepID=A0ABS0BSR3_9GAMM|nr:MULTISPECIES: YchJ family metal-binding protein [Thiomicrorhabdus]MBF6056892.1 hypothetical protein [Thiomicrorhabdus heinhorstiae]
MSFQACLCGSSKAFSDCCQPLIEGLKTAETSEALMRSRYCAFKLRNADYLMQSWDEETRPEFIDFDLSLEWTGLQINGRKKGRKKDGEGWVTFVAHYRISGQNIEGYLHEKSYFRKNNNGLWRYVEGEIKAS